MSIIFYGTNRRIGESNRVDEKRNEEEEEDKLLAAKMNFKEKLYDKELQGVERRRRWGLN